MGSSKAFTIVMSIASALLLLVAVTDARKGGGGGRRGGGGMDDCGRNRTCRELSRECKKMFFASMVDNYVDAGDDEIITTVEKMEAMMEMLMEHQKNLTDCATEMGIELPNSGGKNYMTKSIERPGGGCRRGGKALYRAGQEVREIRFGRKRRGAGGGKWPNENFRVSEEEAKGGKNYMAKSIEWPWGGGCRRGGKELSRAEREVREISFGHKRKGAGGGKWRNENFGVSEEKAKELKKCLLNKKGLLNSDATLNREEFKVQISSAFDSQPGVQTAVEEAVDSCPEPKDYNIQGFVKCINKACIDNLELDDDKDSLKETSKQSINEKILGIPGAITG